MGWLGGGIWGGFGAAAVLMIEFARSVLSKGRRPWPREQQGEESDQQSGPIDYVVAVIAQSGVGVILAAAAATTSEGLNPWVALILGAGSPGFLDRFAGPPSGQGEAGGADPVAVASNGHGLLPPSATASFGPAADVSANGQAHVDVAGVEET